MMSLKSGLLTETAWALDTLTILLSDDATVGFFRLSHLPGFLDTVVEHFRRNMINVFDVLRENEIETGMAERFAYGKSNDTEDPLFGDVLPDQIATENFTSVIVTSCLTDDEERGFCGGVKDWSSGGGDTTMHIQTHFETDPGFYEFPRKDSDGEKAGISENTNQDKSVDSSVAEIEKNEVSKGSENMDAEKESTTSGPEQLNERKNVDTEEFNNLYNGIPSPDAKRLKKSVITADSDVLVKKEVAELLDWERKQTCCNGKEDGPTECECDPAKTEHGSSVNKVELANSVDELESETSPAKIEPDSSVEHDPSSLLIKKLKTEFDLDVEVLGKDSEERPSSLTSCDMSPATPADSECELKQEFPLCSLTLSQDSAISTCNCVSNIIRNLSFVPGNDVEMAKNPALLLILAKLLLLYHMKRKKGIACDSQYNDSESWWQDCLDMVRENTLVTIANIAGYLDLSPLAGNVSRLLLDGLLHWLVCESAVADEPLRSTSASVVLTPKQLVLETLAKMSVLESNVDFILSSPDKPRLAKAYEYLVKLFSDKTNEVTREFALVLLSSFTQANQEICSANSERNLVTVLVGFLEDARDRVESMAVRGLHPGMFRDNDLRVSMGMLRRAGGLLACIAKRTRSTHLIPFQERVLDLSMSRALDAEVQSHLSNVLYNLPR
jgi:AT-rich interactive domain-containing protein 1